MLTGFLRTVILFFVTTIVLRLMGKRQLAELQPYEVVITLMISDLATQPMGDVELPLLGGVVAIVTLLLMHSLLSALAFWSIPLRRIICGRPSVLVRNGRICEDELSRLCFDLSDLMEGIRSQGLIGLQETGSVILETNGALSVFPSSDKRPVTRGEQGLPKIYDGIPLTLILDGMIQKRTLSIAGRDEAWLMRTLKQEGVLHVRNVLVALLDTQGELLVQEKGESGRLMRIQAMQPDEVRW
ncbi:MAG: DUF421 domain-containing protein [Clostridia bacterium]|nr:DUF421 domain-containing protein [Clostridia bacterium]